jgi:pantetheine-phosphate adenylyltransferase
VTHKERSVTIAVYPGSFDPVTNGHLDIARRAARIFDTVVMAVFEQPDKRLLLSTSERLELLREAVKDMPRVRADSYSTLTVEYARSIGASVLVRGLRAVGDFEAEFQLAQVNLALARGIDTVSFMTSPQYTFISSSTVRTIASLGGDVSEYVPAHVAEALRRAYAKAKG